MEALAPPSAARALAPRRASPRARVAPRRASSSRRAVAARSFAGPAPSPPGAVSVSSASDGAAIADVPGSGGVLGSGAACDALVPGADDAHARVEVKQGRVFVTALSASVGTFLGDAKLFPGVAYAVPESAEVRLGDDEGAPVVKLAQRDGGAGTAGVDAMANLMQAQFEAGLDPEIRKALDD